MSLPLLSSSLLLCLAALASPVFAQTAPQTQPQSPEVAVVGSFPMRLAGTDGAASWVVTEPLRGTERGKPVAITLRARRLAGDAGLAVAMVPSPQPPIPPYLYQGTPWQDSEWHVLRLVVVTGLATPRLALAANGPAGQWSIEGVNVEPAAVEAVTRPVPEGLRPAYAPELPPGWRPDGNLDLETRGVGEAQSSLLRLGPLELRPADEPSVRRGVRGGAEVDVFSRSFETKKVTMEISGPPGSRQEVSSFEVPAKSVVTAQVPFQALRCGDLWLRARFTVDDTQKQMPIRVQSTRYWPTLGALWPQGADIAARLSAVGDTQLQFHQVTLPAGRDADTIATLAATGADVGVRWEGDEDAATQALMAIPRALAPQVSTIGMAQKSTAACARFSAAAKQNRSDAVLLTIPFDLHLTPDGLQGDDRLAAELADGQVAQADALALRPPSLPVSIALRQEVDGAGGRVTGWDCFDRAWSLSTLRAHLRERGASLPFFAEGLSGTGTGDPSLDALVMARAIIQVFAEGANAVTVRAVPSGESAVSLLGPDGKPTPLLQVYAELTRELASVRAVAPPTATEFADYLPGRPVTYRAFMREAEGIAVLWNNTSETQHVGVEVRRQPTQTRLLRLSYPGELVQREYTPGFEWSELALKCRRPAIYTDIEPLQMVVLSVQMQAASSQWLREIGPRPTTPPKTDPMDIREFEKLLQKDK